MLPSSEQQWYLFSLPKKMQREIIHRFATGDLRPSSDIGDLKHIGPYLSTRMRHVFHPRGRRLTLRVFARRIAPLRISDLRGQLQRGLQNRRPNRCVTSRSTPSGRYHIGDINEMGWKACRALIHVMGRGRDGHGLGANFTFDFHQLRNPPKRGEDAKHFACVTAASSCRRRGGEWRQGLCVPSRRQNGFPGVTPYSGQKLRTGQRVRGQYVRSRKGSGSWRRPGPLRRVRGRVDSGPQ